MSQQYYEVVEKNAEAIIFFSEKFGAIGELEIENHEEVDGVAKSYRFELEKARATFNTLKSVEPPAGLEEKNANLIDLLEKYFGYTGEAIENLTQKNSAGVKDSMYYQKITAMKIVDLCKTF